MGWSTIAKKRLCLDFLQEQMTTQGGKYHGKDRSLHQHTALQ